MVLRKMVLRRIGVLSVLLASLITVPAGTASAAANLATYGVATASSAEGAAYGADKAIDGDPATRWSSAFADPQTITVDLGASADITGVTLRWEAAHGTAYSIETSADGAAWAPAYATTTGDGGVDEITGLEASARYVRLTGTARATEYGYSLYEFEVLGTFTEQAVSLAVPAVRLAEDGTAEVPVRLNKAAESQVTVAYSTADGTAVAGQDYRAAEGTLTFAPGETGKTITLTGVDDEVNERAETFELRLGEATGAVASPRTSLAVTVTDDDPLPFDGETRVLADLDSQPEGVFAWGDSASSMPALEIADDGDRRGLRVTYDVAQWGGWSHEWTTAEDWSGFDGFSFWVKGTGSGQQIYFEVKDGGTAAGSAELFDASFVDDVAGWRKIQVPFRDFKRRTDYQPGGAPTDGRLELTGMWGYAFRLPAASGTMIFDDVRIYQQVLTVDKYDGEVPIVSGPPEPGIFTFGGDADDHPSLSFADDERGKVLRGTYDISQWGGVVRNLAGTQDWSGFAGVRFWWYGQNTAPLPPGSGKRIFLELKDGGDGPEASELWNTSFTDDWEGWHLVEIPFSRFAYRGDYQPVPGGIDHKLGLTEMWGYAFTMPSGAPGEFRLDDFQVYGVAGAAPKATVALDRPVYSVKENDTVEVRVSVTTTGGGPLDEPVTVTYGTGEGTATAGSDYTPATGTLTFPAGTASGESQTFTVLTLGDDAAEEAETIPITLSATGAGVPAEEPVIVLDAHGLPYLDAKRPVGERVADLLGRMTLAEKVGQMTQAERNALRAQGDIARYALGSLLSGGGSVPTPNTPEAWADMVDGYQLRARGTRLQIPLIYGVDAVHGHNNVVGATIFPHNVGLGATRDPDLVEKTGTITAKEVKATGVPWDFAPCLCVSRDERWGRAYESFGEDPALVTRMATIIDGLQDEGVLATAKHYVGDGGTKYGSSTTGDYTIDQGVTEVTRAELEAVHLAPFREALRRGVGSVMPSYSSVDYLGDAEGPVKMHAHADLITNVLKKSMGFRGFVISDWQAIDQIPGDYPSDVRTSINAGLDMIMVPTRYEEFVATLTAEVQAGRVPMARIDDAVSRILTQKFRLGLFEKPYTDRSGLADVGSAAHREVARTAAAKSQVLLKNAGRLLPLPKTAKVYVAGSNADDIGNQSGGWTISWQGSSGPITEGTTILQGIRAATSGEVTYSADASAPTAGHDVGVVVVGETPYAEGVGDVGVNGRTLSLSAADTAAIEKVCAAMKCAVLVVSGRPLLLGPVLEKATAVVASWLPGSEGAGVADPLFGAVPYTGRLPFTWPRQAVPINVGDAAYDPQFPYGWGLRTDAPRTRLKAVRDQLLKVRGDAHATAAAAALTVALLDRNWAKDGTVREPRVVLTALATAAGLLERARKDTFAQIDAVVSVARDVAQSRPQTPDRVKAQALAEHEHLSGRHKKAVEMLAR
ncbi:beta-glucosidase [Thermocatellispora tengchongensis]|uniref:beta-glucosidase n=1 Tax=Thermocatellispora tengchongensis TaxID=1073253 RepID=A0A840PAH6_9ACTN|nr:glycoside hydrolase family 3 N-terminal domain-containing protein [Thermocatellispora tengchongensis]MBB5134933.1 beta-glucosidase [Thermocatellispora tengchongensis]